MHIKICEKCNNQFETDNHKRKFCNKSCANSFNTSKRKIEDESIYQNGLNRDNVYILGLIYSDGCLSYDKHTKRYRITIALNDKEIMEEVHRRMTPNKKLYQYQHPNGNRPTYSVISTNPYDIEFIKKLGIVERKSLILQMPNIPQNFISDFIRGFFDGDGSVYINRTKTNHKGVIKYYSYINANFTIGSKDFAQQLQKQLLNYDIKSNIVKDSRENTNCYYVKIYNKKSVLKFKDFIYKDANLFLQRKYSKFYCGDIVQTESELTD